MHYKSLSVAAAVTFALSMSGAFADETSSSMSTSETPAGTASTATHTHSDSMGNSAVHSRTATQDANGISTHAYHAASGPDGTAQSASHTNIHVNGAGGLTTSKSKEATVATPSGSSHVSVQHETTTP